MESLRKEARPFLAKVVYERVGELGVGRFTRLYSQKKHNMLLVVLVYISIIMTLFMQVYAHFRKKFRNYACAFYIKFGKNTSITMQQASIWQKKPWVSELVMHML